MILLFGGYGEDGCAKYGAGWSIQSASYEDRPACTSPMHRVEVVSGGDEHVLIRAVV
jgi:hypothetical protein